MIDSFRTFINVKGETCLYSLGQAGFIVKNKSGNMLAIDPYLSDCVEELEGHIGFKRLLPKIVQPAELELDVIIATHAHLDHYDKDSIPDLIKPSETRLFASDGCKEYAIEQGLDQTRVQYVAPGDKVNFGGFDIEFIPCDHGDAAPDAFGVIIETDGRVICETGDTCLREDYKGSYLSRGSLDILIAPINGAYGNMDEKDCARLAELVKPRVTIPCHYGMFASHGGDIGRFYEIMREKNFNVNLMAQGEIMYL